MSMLVNPYRFGAVVGHRYWGIKISDSVAGTASTGFSELEFFDAAGALMSYGKTGAISAGWTLVGSQSIATRATDGLIGDAAAGNVAYVSGSYPVYMWLDFGSAVTPAMMRVTGYETAYASANPKDYAMVWSDDASSFTAVATVTGDTTWRDHDYKHVNHPSNPPAWTGQQAFSSTQWRIRCDDYYANLFEWGFAELEMYETVGGAAVAPSSATATTTAGGTAVANLYDNTDTTFWNSSTGGSQSKKSQYVAYTFSSAKKIAEIGLRARNDGGAPADIGKQMPKEVFLEWHDGTNWRYATKLFDPNGSYAAKGVLRKYALPISL